MNAETGQASSRFRDASSNHLKIYRRPANVGSKPNAAGFVPHGLIEATLGSASDAIIATDADGRITFWNPGATRIFGFTSEQAVGNSLDLIIPENLRARHWADTLGYWQPAKANAGHGEVLSLPWLTKDGRRISVESAITLLHKEADELIGTDGTSRGIGTD
jgi:PAS domain S-box-containing protein